MASTLARRGILALKGMAMGAADVVPGVSGGTIAFITGVYEELLASLRSFDVTALKKLFRQGPAAFWKHINGAFLLPLVLGIGLSIASLAKGITYLLAHHPVLLWSFFFGLILASIWLVGRTVRRWNPLVVVGLLVGTGVSYYITTITHTADQTTNLGYLTLCGVVSICAMILPGISGSFVLLLMGAYQLVITTVKDLVEKVLSFEFGQLGDPLKVVGAFAAGAVVGLISFSHVLTWLFRRFHDFTIALLTGFLVGSLNKIWPWKETLTTRLKHAGRPDESCVPVIQVNVWPADYATVNEVERTQLGIAAKDPVLLAAIGLAVFGVVLILVLERFGPPAEEPSPTGPATDPAR